LEARSIKQVAEGIRSFLKDNFDRYVRVLSDLVAIPSVSARGEHMDDCARLVADLLAERGFRVRMARAGI